MKTLVRTGIVSVIMCSGLFSSQSIAGNPQYVAGGRSAAVSSTAQSADQHLTHVRGFLFTAAIPGQPRRPTVPDFVQGTESDCDGIEEYLVELEAMRNRLENPSSTLSLDKVESWTGADFTAAADIYESIKQDAQVITPPVILAAFHAAFTELVGSMSQLFDAAALAGPFAILAYEEILEGLKYDLASSSLQAEIACNVAIFDHDDDGDVEIGPGGAASSGAQDEADSGMQTGSGTRFDPIPIGQSVVVDSDWKVTVVGVLPDATDLVVANSEWNDLPATGLQFFIARIVVEYVGSSSDEFGARWRLSAVGNESVAYTMSDDDCGEVPEALEDREVFKGGQLEGNICWTIQSTDADSLVMYDSDVDNEDRIFFSLVPTSPEHSLEATTSGVESEPAESSPVPPPDVPGSPVVFRAASPESSPIASPTGGAATILLRDILFVPDTITIRADFDVAVTLSNQGAAEHNFSVTALEISVDVQPGTAETIVINVPAGEYEFYCDIPGHREAGMVGTLTVE